MNKRTNLGQTSGSNRFLEQNHSETRQSNENTMTNITEHHTKQERECDDGKKTRVDFLIRRDTIGVNDGLETFGEAIGAVIGRRGLGRWNLVQNWRDSGTGCLL